jgi:hypothetical protein
LNNQIHVTQRVRAQRGGQPQCRQELRTPNEGINLRYLKNLADVADKIYFGCTYKFGVGVTFQPCSEDNFLYGRL